MGFELPNGKTARNLQDQVKFLSEKLKDLYAAFNDSGLKKIEIVEELPEVGDPTVLYLLARQDPEQDDYYEEYLWYDNAWEKIGTTHIDLSDYCTLSTDQTITGTKTIGDTSAAESPELKFENSYIEGSLKLSGYSLTLSGATTVSPYPSNSIELGNNTYLWSKVYTNELKTNYIGINNKTLKFNGGKFIPELNNTNDLGESDHAWKDLYLSGTAYLPVVKLNDNVELSISVASNYALAVKGQIYPFADNSTDLGGTYRKFRNLYLGSNLTDGTNSATVEALVKKARIYTHTIICSNGTLVLIGSFSTSITSQSSLSMASSSALKMEWEGNTVLKIVNGTTIHYYDPVNHIITTATIGTFTSDTITDY